MRLLERVSLRARGIGIIPMSSVIPFVTDYSEGCLKLCGCNFVDEHTSHRAKYSNILVARIK